MNVAKLEVRSRLTELRLEGRRLSGIVLKYGDTSYSHKERFESGSLSFADPIVFNRAHDRDIALAWLPHGGLQLEDSDEVLSLIATLPPISVCDSALADVRAGKIRGLSVEFLCLQDRREDGIRVISSARLVGVGLVKHPSYGASRVEARSARDARLAVWETLR